MCLVCCPREGKGAKERYEKGWQDRAKTCDFTPPGRGKSDSAGRPICRKTVQACAFPISPAPTGIPWLAWTLSGHLCPHCRTPRGLFPTRSVPVGGAASQLQAELITAITPPVGCATQSISESLNTQRALAQAEGHGLLLKKAQANLERENS